MTASVISLNAHRNARSTTAPAIPPASTDDELAQRYAMTATKLVALCRQSGMDPVVLAGSIVAAAELDTLSTETLTAMTEQPESPAPAQRPGVVDRYRGAKYEDGLDVAEIAKRVRADIKAARKFGELDLPVTAKVSVRIDRYSLGCSLHVHVSGLSRDQLWNDYAAGHYAEPA